MVDVPLKSLATSELDMELLIGTHEVLNVCLVECLCVRLRVTGFSRRRYPFWV